MSERRRLLIGDLLPRHLLRATTPAEVHQLIVDACARALTTRSASLALYDEAQHWLAIAATHGYAAVLVKSLRVRPGVGIIGRVFRSGRALRVDDIRQFDATRQPRPRYSTPAFMAVPVIGPDHPHGVICVSDRSDGSGFDRGDLRTLRRIADVSSLALEREKARLDGSVQARVAAIDPLTGLFNRGYFQLRLEEEVERAHREATPLTTLMVDIDNFKELNDRFGHPAGDVFLRHVANVLRRSVRLFDVCARFGGDEFVILMPGIPPGSTEHIAERIREGIAAVEGPGCPWAPDFRPTASIGVAVLDRTTGDDLIGRADAALYAAKRSGKNRVSLCVKP